MPNFVNFASPVHIPISTGVNSIESDPFINILPDNLINQNIQH